MTIALEPPITYGSRHRTSTAIREAPAFARTVNMSRWHVLRSGYTYRGREIYTPWCGAGSLQIGASVKHPALLVDEITDGGAVCGTCIGRAHGAGHDVGLISVGNPGGLLFSPRGTIRRPDSCPGADRTAYTPDVKHTYRFGTCWVCGYHGNIRGGSRGYSWTPLHLEKHAPVELVDPCPFHLWTHISEKGVCACGHEPWEVAS